jgi:PAS domain S-box-containing protein
LPIKQGTDSQIALENSQTLVNLNLSGCNEAFRILHVDDDLIVLKISKQILEMENKFEIDVATSTEEAFKKLSKKSYDAIVSDYEMPTQNGLQFLKELREQGYDIPFIIFTGKSKEEAAIRALNLGADGYFTKYGDPEFVYAELAHGIRKSVEMKRTKAKACIEEARLKAILSSSPDAIIIADLSGKIVNCNEGLVQLAGYSSKEDIIGRNASEIIQEKGLKSTEITRKLKEHPANGKIEISFMKSGGEECLVEFSVGMLRDESGNSLGHVGVLRDISERKKAAEQNRKLANELTRVFDAITDMMFITDNEKRIVRVNKRACEFLKKKPEDVLGKYCFEVMHGTDKPWEGCPHAKVLETKNAYSAVIDDPHIGKRLIVSVSPIFGEKGEFVQCIHSAKDIADLKKVREPRHHIVSAIEFN